MTTNKAMDYHVKWSPDVKTLSFASQRDGEPGIWLIPAEGGQAVKLGLKDRGSIKKGRFADMVIFDPLNIADKEALEMPSPTSRISNYY